MEFLVENYITHDSTEKSPLVKASLAPPVEKIFIVIMLHGMGL